MSANIHLADLVSAHDRLLSARGFVRCAFMAANSLDDEDMRDGLTTVLNASEEDIDKVMQMLTALNEQEQKAARMVGGERHG